MATTISSNNGKARLTNSKCPVVIGSKEPGKTAIFFIILVVLILCFEKFCASSQCTNFFKIIIYVEVPSRLFRNLGKIQEVDIFMLKQLKGACKLPTVRCLRILPH